MGVSLLCWRVRIGTFNSKTTNMNLSSPPSFYKFDIMNALLKFFEEMSTSLIFFTFFLYILKCGDIEKNPGPRNRSHNSLKLMHWNLNSFSTSNFYRKDLIETFNLAMEYDIIAISESALHSNVDDTDLLLDGYIHFRRDLPADRQYGGILVYVRNSIACEEMPDLETIADQLIIKLTIDNKLIFISSNYRKHHQDDHELTSYMENFQKSCENIRSQNPFCTIHIGDFNSHNATWLNTDTTDSAGEKLNEIVNDEALVQLVNQPTHVTSVSNTLIDLVITDQPNIINVCSVLPSLDSRCHHQINNVELNIFNPPPPSFSRRIWHYGRANPDLINQAINEIDWTAKLEDLDNSPNLQVAFFNETLMNIFSNFIPNEYKKINKRQPPWFSNNVNNIHRRLSRKYAKYKERGFPLEMKAEIDELRKNYVELVNLSKDSYLKTQGLKLLSFGMEAKKYWTILKGFISSYAIPVIPPLKINNVYVSDFQHKAEEFNKYFADQCTPIQNSSSLPNFNLLTNIKLNHCDVSEETIFQILSKLNISKSHGCDNLSAHMLKVSARSISKPLAIIFRNCLQKGVFPEIWKKADVVPIHKKNEKNLITNYRPISLLPICSKVFERIIFNSLYTHFIGNHLITWRQSGFIKKDSTINQLLSITEMIRQTFDCDPPKEVRAIFLDISKAFDKVWHEGLIFKLKQNGVEGEVLNILTSFLSGRKQRTIINGKMSSWRDILAGVPQGSVLGPLLFLIYINDIVNGMTSDVRIFADDTSLFKIIDCPNIAYQELQHDLDLIQKWAYQWKMIFNPDPSKPPVEIIFSRKTKPPYHPTLLFNGVPLHRVTEHKHLGVILDKKLKFKKHINEICNKASKLLGVVKISKAYVPIPALEKSTYHLLDQNWNMVMFYIT